MTGAMVCLEVKSAEWVKSEHFKHLRWFRERYGAGRRMKSVVLYAGRAVRQFSEDE